MFKIQLTQDYAAREEKKKEWLIIILLMFKGCCKYICYKTNIKFKMFLKYIFRLLIKQFTSLLISGCIILSTNNIKD